MTLRRRLLLVFLIVVLLSVGTVGVASYELSRTERIYGPLQVWHEIVLVSNKLASAFPHAVDLPPEENEFNALMARLSLNLARVSDYLDVDWLRDYQFRVRRAYDYWHDATPDMRDEQAVRVNEAIEALTLAAEGHLARLTAEADRLTTRKWVLLTVVLSLTTAQILIVGWLLRRWLLEPMERLGRQVEALGRDQPPPEPLLTQPLEMASLAAAMDRARQSLHRYRQQLIDAERLTTIGQFAAQLAHNLRNPLASIRAAAQVTARHERDNTAVRERMDEVVASVDRLNHWIAGLMEVARREPTPSRSGDVVPVLHRIRDALASEAGAKEMALVVEAPEAGLICAHDPATLEQALVAMVVNAIEASPLGRQVTLRAEVVAPASGSAATGGNGHPPAVCRISVVDEGPGLPADNCERIFDFSYSTKQKGMGLGLALARLALERQGGEAHARNGPAGGAVVYVDLPIPDTDPSPDPVSPAVSSAARPQYEAGSGSGQKEA